MASATPAPDYRTGKICYLEIPATNVSVSAEFYARVFDWHIRERDDGSIGFDDPTGAVSGAWVLDRLPAPRAAGVQIAIMVAHAASVLEEIVAAGGSIVQPPNAAEREVYALFADPAGNVLCIYQQPGLDEPVDAGADAHPTVLADD